MTLATYKPLTADERTALRIARATAKAYQANRALSLIFYAPFQDVRQTFPGAGEQHVTGCGCGKTHLAVSLAKVAIDALHDAKLTTEPDLLDAIKRSYGDTTVPAEADILAELSTVWLLVLDDLGTSGVRSQEWYQDIMYTLFNRRYIAGLPVICTTNLTPDQLRERLGTRTWSRLAEMARIFRLDGPDRREMRTTCPGPC